MVNEAIVAFDAVTLLFFVTSTFPFMATAKLKRTVVAAGLIALTVILIGTLWQANRKPEIEIVAQEPGVSEPAPAAAKILKAEEPPVEESSGISEPGVVASASASSSNMNSMKGLLENPMIAEAMKREMRSQYGGIYRELFEDLGFADDEIEVLTDLLIVRKFAEAMTVMEVVGTDEETREAALAEARAPVDKELDELLSPSAAEKLAEVERTLAERLQVRKIGSQLSLGDDPLTFEQGSRLFDVLVAAKEKSDTAKYAERVWTLEEAPDRMAEMVVYHARIRDDAASFLSAEQIAALESSQESLRKMMKSASDWNAKK